MSAHEGSAWQAAHEAEAATRKRRDAHTEQLIADARSNVETPLEGPFDDKPDPTEQAARRAADGTFGSGSTDLVIRLEGEGATAYSEFCAASKALADNQRAAAVVLERYKAALQRLSEAAAKVG